MEENQGESFNAADRLSEMLKKAAEMEGGFHVNRVWAGVFGFDQTDGQSVSDSLALARDVLKELESQVFKTGMPPDLYLKYNRLIAKVLTPRNLDEAWHNTKEKLTSGLFDTLNFCSQLIANHGGERCVPQSQIDDILKQVSNLEAQIQSGKLNRKLRILLLDLLESMRRSIRAYRISGKGGLQKEIASIFLQLNRDHVEVDISGDEEKSVLNEFIKICKAVGETAGCIETVKKLSDGVAELFLTN